MLNTLFQHGFLVLHEITLDTSYRQLKLIADHDMVHPMANLEEMADRLGKDRLCFALYHRLMPNEPVIFIEVALTRSHRPHHHRDHPKRKIRRKAERRGGHRHVLFHQQCTAGADRHGTGKVLIGRVVEHIKQARPNIKNFPLSVLCRDSGIATSSPF